MPAATKSESMPDQLDLYRLRDDLAHNYNPVNAHERMLVTQIAQSWLRLQRASEIEKQCFHGRDMVEFIATKLNEFKAITRYVTDCERAWRHAVLNLEKSQRQRKRLDLSSPNARRTYPVTVDPAAPPGPALPPSIPSPVAATRRE